jgi:cytoskeletal protein CcmA (bactofilin family)
VVKGNVHAKEIVVHGRVEGDIHAERVELAPTAHVTGDIYHDRQLAIADGAFFTGACRRLGDSRGKRQFHLAVAAE